MSHSPEPNNEENGSSMSVTELAKMLMDERESRVREEHRGLEQYREGRRDGRGRFVDGLARVAKILKKSRHNDVADFVLTLGSLVFEIETDQLKKSHRDKIVKSADNCSNTARTTFGAPR